MRAVAQMGAQGRARVGRRVDLFRRRVGVADRDANAVRDQLGDVGRAVGEVRRHRDQPDQALARLLPAFELRGVGWPDLVTRVDAPGPVLLRQVRTLHMDERDRVPDERVVGPGPDDLTQAVEDVLLGGRHHGWHHGGDADREQRPRQRTDHLRPGGGVVGVEARVAVDLQVDQTGREPGRLVAGPVRAVQVDLRDHTVAHGDGEPAARRGVAAGEFEGGRLDGGGLEGVRRAHWRSPGRGRECMPGGCAARWPDTPHRSARGAYVGPRSPSPGRARRRRAGPRRAVAAR